MYNKNCKCKHCKQIRKELKQLSDNLHFAENMVNQCREQHLLSFLEARKIQRLLLDNWAKEQDRIIDEGNRE